MHVFQPVAIEDILEGAFHFGGDDWALVTAEKDGKVNTMTVSWGGITRIWNKVCAVVYIRESRYTKEFIDATGEFSISFLDKKEYRGMKKYLGSVSGRDEDKIKNARLNVNYCNGVPFIDEASDVIICKVLSAQLIEPESFVDESIADEFYKDGDYHVMYIGEITQVQIR